MTNCEQYSTFEHQTIVVTTNNSHKVYIHNIYKPPSAYKLKFLEEFESFLKQIIIADGRYILARDFNQTWDQNERLDDIAQGYNFKQQVSQATNIFGNRTDQIYTKNILISGVQVSDRISTSKHYAISCFMPRAEQKHQAPIKPCFSRNYKLLDIPILKSRLLCDLILAKIRSSSSTD